MSDDDKKKIYITPATTIQQIQHIELNLSHILCVLP